MKVVYTYKNNKFPYVVNCRDTKENWESEYTGKIEKYQKLADALNEFYDGMLEDDFTEKFEFNVGIKEDHKKDPPHWQVGDGVVFMETRNTQLIFSTGDIELRRRDFKKDGSWRTTDWRIEHAI